MNEEQILKSVREVVNIPEVLNVQQEFIEDSDYNPRRAIIVIPVVDLYDEFKYEVRLFVKLPEHEQAHELKAARVRCLNRYHAEEICEDFIKRRSNG